MSEGHTPTPWIVNEDCFDEDEVEITSQDRLDNSMLDIATVKIGGFNDEIEDQQRADAEFIVRAVNAHDDLVAALEALAKLVDAQPWGSIWAGRPHAEMDAARAALAKASA